MQRGRKFSLAGALFGWPPAPGHRAPGQQVPDAWLLLFKNKHIRPDPAVQGGLFTACRSGRDFILESTPKVTVTLDTTVEQPRSAWCRRKSSLPQALGARGPQPIGLKVVCDGSQHSAASVAAVAGLVDDVSAPITELTLAQAWYSAQQGASIIIELDRYRDKHQKIGS